MSTRYRDGASAGQLINAVVVAGSMARYTFYISGAIVMAMIIVIAAWLWSSRAALVIDSPAFRIADGSVAGHPVSTDVVTGRFGRIEVMQYGALQNRSTDLTVVMRLPPNDGPTSSALGADLHETNLLRNVRAVHLSTHYDLETRYGPLHAVDARIEVDGRLKQCLSFSSRFRTNTVALLGWTCDATGGRPGAEALACVIDKLMIDKPLASKEADAYMRERMARPADCSASPVTQNIDVRSRPVSPPSRWSQPSSRTRL